MKFELPIREDFETGLEDAKKHFHKALDFFAIMSINKFSYTIPYLPEFIGRILTNEIFRTIDLVYSNVPFSSKAMHICNKAVHKIGVYSRCYYDWKLFFVATTYRNELWLTAMGNENLKMDPQLLIDYTLDFLEKEIEEFGDGDIDDKKDK